MDRDTVVKRIDSLREYALHGRVTGVIGLTVEVAGLEGHLAIGDRCRLLTRQGEKRTGEVIGFREGRSLVMPYGPVEGLGPGTPVEMTHADVAMVAPTPGWTGRMVDAFGQPIDGRGPLPLGNVQYPIRAAPPPAARRMRIGDKLDVGVRTINAFLSCCRGQRLGVFAGSGVGKSSLLSMLARYARADVTVIGLIGERGREAREFVEDDLGAAGLGRSVVVVATSDQAPAVRRQAAFTTLAVAEYFRDRGAHVLCLMDSVTRFAMAQREIGLAAGEPPTTKGYPPSVFAELPLLLERAGPGMEGTGSITALFTVLVDGDDHDEPIADAVRGILDGHIVLDRSIAERGLFPAINILRSVSRSMPGCNNERERQVIAEARRLLAVYEDMGDLIRLGAYKHGSDPEIDRAIALQPALNAFRHQRKDEPGPLADVYRQLEAIIASPPETGLTSGR